MNKLEEVVNKKHGEAEKIKPKTQIVSTSFARTVCILAHMSIHTGTHTYNGHSSYLTLHICILAHM